MSLRADFILPTELELLEFFGVEPTTPEEGVYYYEIADNRGCRLRFSFSFFERSIQSVVVLKGSTTVSCYQEGAVALSIRGESGAKVLVGELDLGSATSTVMVRVHPVIEVKWSSLLRHSRE